MKRKYIVAFFGHRYIDEIIRVETLLENVIQRLMDEKEYVEFQVGCRGDFDRCVSSSVRRVRKNYKDDNSALTLLLPYVTADYCQNQEFYEKYYTDIIISSVAAKAHPKAAMQICNREMVDRADLIICYIEHKKGGAWQTINYAIKHNKHILNLADMQEDGFEFATGDS